MRRSHPTARAEFFKIMLRIKSRVVPSEDNTNEVANGFCRNRFFVEGNNDRHQFLRCERTVSINCCRFTLNFLAVTCHVTLFAYVITISRFVNLLVCQSFRLL